MQKDTSHLTIEELAERVNIPIRTVRYYITEGLLPGPEGRGKATTYNAEHLQRLRLIRLLSNQRRPLAEIHQLLNRLSLSEISALLVEEEQRARELEPEGQPPSPQEYIATLLKNAQISRLPASPEPPLPQLAPVAPLRMYESSQVYENLPAALPETWKRLELAPGIELHVQESVEEQQRSLLERIYKAAGIPAQRYRK